MQLSLLRIGAILPMRLWDAIFQMPQLLALLIFKPSHYGKQFSMIINSFKPYIFYL
jgi:hypothetical protein